jgi:hypothetical protein
MSQPSTDARAVVRAIDRLAAQLSEAGEPLRRIAEAQLRALAAQAADAPTTTADETCRPLEVDGETIQVRGSGTFTTEDARLFGQIVRAAKRRYEAEHGPVPPMPPLIPAATSAADAQRSAEIADDEQRAARRDSTANLLARLSTHGYLSEAETALLRQHVEAEQRDTDTSRAVARANLRHVRTIVPEIDRLATELEQAQTRAETAETELRTLRDGIRELGGDPTQIQNLWAQLTLTSRQRGEEMARADRAQAALDRVRAAAKWARQHHPGLRHVHDRFTAALDGTEQPATEQQETGGT